MVFLIMELFFFLLFFLLLFTFVYGSLSAAPWVPGRTSDVKRFVELVEIKPGQLMYDLGCGDGRFVCAAATAGARAVGFEVSLLPYFLAQVRRLMLTKEARARCEIRFKNFWKISLHEVDVLYCFLLPEVYDRLKEKCERELKPTAKVVVYVWAMKDWEPVVVNKCTDRPVMYVYEKINSNTKN